VSGWFWRACTFFIQKESNRGNSGFALEIPLNHKKQIWLATEKETITELWILYELVYSRFVIEIDDQGEDNLYTGNGKLLQITNYNYVYRFKEA